MTDEGVVRLPRLPAMPRLESEAGVRLSMRDRSRESLEVRNWLDQVEDVINDGLATASALECEQACWRLGIRWPHDSEGAACE